MTSPTKKLVCVTGTPGVGKSTIAKALEKRGIRSISIDEEGLCSWRCRATNQQVTGNHTVDNVFIEKHRWICDIVRLKKILAESNETVVVCGVVSNQEEYMDLFDTILLLQCQPEILVKRLDERPGGHGKDKAIQRKIFEWQKEFEKSLLAKGAVPINAELPLGQVVDEIMSHL